MNRLLFAAVILLALLAGCADSDHRLADEKVLCDPHSHQAYYIKPNVGSTSFVLRNPNLDGVCK